MSAPAIEIISHPLCPHTQRLILVCLHNRMVRDLDFNVIYLKLATLRETASRYSPTGEIPALLINRKFRTAIIEHAAEYLNAVSCGNLMPTDPLEQLMMRGRVQMIQCALDTLRRVFTANEERALHTELDAFFALLAKLEASLINTSTDPVDLFKERMDLVALAPLFSLTFFHDALRDHPGWYLLPALRALGMQLMAHPIVNESRCPDYAAEFDRFFTATNSRFPELIHP